MSIYPNDYCHECQQTPSVEQPAPPNCAGEKCVEIYNAECIQYNGADIPCKQIEKGDRLDEVINKLSTCYNEEFVRGLLRMIRDDENLKALFAQIVCSIDCNSITVCEAPSGIVASNPTTEGFTLSWAKITGVSGYYVRVKKVDSSTWINVGGLILNSAFSTGTATVNITGLESGSAYEAQVKTLCNDGSESSWAASVTSDTQIPVAPPSCNTPSTPTITFS